MSIAEQKRKILEYVAEHQEGITNLEATIWFACGSASKRMSELFNEGKLTKERVSVKGWNREGKWVEMSHFIRYKAA